jgi:Mn-dependent DtxR family transcriptional regulator
MTKHLERLKRKGIVKLDNDRYVRVT